MTPNTQGASWEEEFDERWNWASFTWNGDNVLGKRSAVQTRRSIKAFVRKLLSKERADGERRERERILAALPETDNYDPHSDADEAVRNTNNGYKWGHNEAISKIRTAITTLPADSTEV